jgi:hypothetical protein
MPHQFDLLPIELQASVVELRAAHVAEDTIDTPDHAHYDRARREK